MNHGAYFTDEKTDSKKLNNVSEAKLLTNDGMNF